MKASNIKHLSECMDKDNVVDFFAERAKRPIGSAWDSLAKLNGGNPGDTEGVKIIRKNMKVADLRRKRMEEQRSWDNDGVKRII